MAVNEPQGSTEEPTAPEPITFLTRSWNRYEVLHTLANEPRTRDELLDLTGVSRPTLSRILSDLMSRDWIVRHNDEYEATPNGSVIAAECRRFTANLDAVDHLDGTLEWLETDALGFDLRHLRDAEVITPDLQNQTAPMRTLADRIANTSEMCVVASGVTYEVVENICQACLAGELTLRCVLDDRALAGLQSHPDLADMFADMVARDVCDAYRFDGQDDLVDCNLLDDLVMFCGHTDDGRPAGIVIAEHPTVRSWTAYYFDSLREDAEPLEPDVFVA